MFVDGVARRTIWLAKDGETVEIIDQTKLPHRFETVRLASVEEAAHAIKVMQVRGAPLIGATAAYGIAISMENDASDDGLRNAYDVPIKTRPTAVNLRWSPDRVKMLFCGIPPENRAKAFCI